MYQGSLIYVNEDEDVLEFESFIIRNNEISFRATTTWNKSEKWSIDTIAALHGKQYETDNASSFQEVYPTRTVPCQIVFSEVLPQEYEVTVKGYWLEKGNKYHFSGTLDLKD